MLEQIYQQFTTQILPKIAQGIMITKDYFIDLFGRYVKYLIVTDALWALVCLLGILLSLFFVHKISKFIKKERETYSSMGEIYLLYFLPAMPLIMFTVFFLIQLTDLAKDIFIPEVRIYEQLSTKIDSFRSADSK